MDAAQIKSRIGCSSISFLHLPLPQALDQIQALGFDAVDIGVLPAACPHIDLRRWGESDTACLAADLARRKLRLSSLNMNVAGLAVRDDGDLLGFFETTLKIGAGLRAGTVTLPVGPAVAEDRWRAEAERLAGRMRHLAGIAHELGVRVSLEAPHTGTLASNYTQSARLFDVIKDPRVGSTLDTSHGQFNDPRPLVEGLAAVGAEIFHVHLRDVLGNSFGITPGKGMCDYAPFLQALMTAGYEGDLNLELEGTPTGAEAEARFARRYLEIVLAGEPLPPEFAVWRSPKRRLLMRTQQAAADPRSCITSLPGYPAIQPLVQPWVRLAKSNFPIAYYRYESGWNRRHLTRKTRRVALGRPSSRRAAGAKPKRVAILGCGNIGLNMHGPSFASLADAEVVGVCDSNHGLALAAGKVFDCPAFSDLAELVHATRPGLVANCTTEAAHSSTSIYLLEQGVDVFCEKIMAESIASGELMVKRAAERGRVLAVNFNWRFHPAMAKLREIKEAGTLGELCLLRFVCHAHLWHHVLDLVNFLAGKAVKIAAQTRLDPLFEDRRGWRRFADELLYLPGVFANALIETAEGVGATVTSSELWKPDGYLLNLDAVFRRGVISLSGVNPHDLLGILSCDRPGIDLGLDTGVMGGSLSYAVTFKRSIEAFMAAYGQGKRPPTTGEDGLVAMRMEQAVVESAKSGRTVTLD